MTMDDSVASKAASLALVTEKDGYRDRKVRSLVSRVSKDGNVANKAPPPIVEESKDGSSWT